ncbi:hypothetical protein KUCAC02_017300, partial [Chaenocephalus aceratus]
FSWTCKPVSSLPSSCFHDDVPTSSSVLVFPSGFLKHNFDQFQVTLTVHSGERSASSEVFLTFTPNVIGCHEEKLNWDQPFSVSAVCEGCDTSTKNIQYTWSLFLVNASSKPAIEEPSPISSLNTRTSGSGEEPFYHPLGPLYSSTEYPPLDNSGVLYSDHFTQSGVITPDSSADWEFPFPLLQSEDVGDRPDPDYDVPVMEAEEGDPGISAGRPSGVDGESFGPGDDSEFDLASHGEEGSNLVDSGPSVGKQEPTLLDVPRHPVDRGLFESYTYTGGSAPLLSLRPFSLAPGSRYMLENLVVVHLAGTQLFFKTNPAPKGVACQVQPIRGVELYTHFSIFCTSGKQYSISVGDGPRRTLYAGRDFQYYFSLPSGDPADQYKVTIFTEIRSSSYGTATKPWSGLRNLSALVHLGNSLEVRNHVSLLSGILNRLSLHTESNGQASMEDNICILKNLLEVTRQVTIASARRVAAHVQDVSQHFPESGGPASYRLEQNTLHSLLSLLSFSLQTSTRADITHMLDPDPREEASRGGGGSISTKQVEHLVADILQAASDLMLKFILMHKVQEHRVSTGLIALYSSYQNRSSTVISSGSSSFSLPPSLIQLVHGSRPRCVLSTLTELRHSPFTWDPGHRRLSGPVVELSLNQCRSRRKIPVRSLIEPIIIQLKQPSNNSSEREYVLLRSRVNHHSFNLTQKHLQQAIQLSVVFTPPSKPFPIMLLFRMFERPTPSMHHLQGIHSWKSNVTRFTLPSSSLSAAGVGHVALLDADFGKRPGAPPLSEQVSYSLSVDSSLCLSWDGQQGAWSPRGCRTQQTDASPDVTCRCHQLRPLTVERQQIHSSHETTHLDPFLR